MDKYKIEYETGKHSEELILNANEVIKSPGIPDDADIVKKLNNKNIKVISEIEFAGRYTKAKKICITGSNGKTTTTMLIYHIFKKAGLNVALAGNVGKSFALQVAENNYDYYIIELSSFQLDGMYDFKADIAVILNITPDHLDRYNYDFNKYVDSKFRIIRNQTEEEKFIYWSDDKQITKEINKRCIKSELFPFSGKNICKKGAFIKNETINIIIKEKILTIKKSEMSLLGTHNAYNSMAAVITSKLNRIQNHIIKESILDFENVPHRLEKYISIKGIQFINDSKATNINSTWYALQSIGTKIVLILGGVDKGNDYSIIKKIVDKKVKAIVCLGKDNSRIFETFGNDTKLFETKSMQKAVNIAYKYANAGDTVLLSPACASFDLFENYEDRGNKLKKAVMKIENKKTRKKFGV